MGDTLWPTKRITRPAGRRKEKKTVPEKIRKKPKKSVKTENLTGESKKNRKLKRNEKGQFVPA